MKDDVPDSYSNAFEKARDWLLNSGIQSVGTGKFSGSYTAWYDLTKKTYSFPYSEVTGLGITTLCYLYSLHEIPVQKLNENGVAAVKWLKAAFASRAYRCRADPHTGEYLLHLCSFDNAMILNGLVNLYTILDDDKLMTMAKKIGDWLVDVMQQDDGSFNAKYSLDKNSYLNSLERWSTQPGVYHAKNSIGLLNLWKLTSDDKYKKSTERVLNWTLQRQEEDGRFITNERLKDTYMHAQCYALEGLLVGGLILKKETYIKGFESGLEWLVKAQSQTGTGGLPMNYDSSDFSNEEHADSIAQATRLWLLASHEIGLKKYEENALKSLERLLNFQFKGKDPRADGGFRYSCKEGKFSPHISAHSTMFATQAIRLYLTYMKSEKGFDVYLYI